MILLKNDRKFDAPKAFLKENEISGFSTPEKYGKKVQNFDWTCLIEILELVRDI